MEPTGTENDSVSVDSLFILFGDVVTRDVIVTVVESCGGDLNQSLDAIMRITNDNTGTEHSSQTTESKSNENEPTSQHNERDEGVFSQNHSSNQSAPHTAAHSYAAAFQNTGATPKQRIQPIFSNFDKSRGWDNQSSKILDYHNKGYRTLIILRGAPGSGKTFLAHRIIKMIFGSEITDIKRHIYSADDFFMSEGRYLFDKNQLREAHQSNQMRARKAMEQGLSPVVIDNTNIEIWEMEPYARIGVVNGYLIEIVEPDTPWAKKPNQLYRRNVHDVPVHSIRRMLDNYENNITGTSLLQKLGLCYPSGKVPPMIRSIPVYQIEERNLDVVQVREQMSVISITVPADNIEENNATAPPKNSDVPSTFNDEESEENKIFHRNTEIEKQFEEFAKVEQEWDNGENWVDGENQSNVIINVDESINSGTPQPQRQNIQLANKILDNVNKPQDWSQISIFMPSWASAIPPQSSTQEQKTETMSNSTCIEIGDFHASKNIFKVITATPRDINEFYMSFDKEKIPDVRKLDKSSMTINEHFIMDSPTRCKSEDKHFKEFRNLFKNLPKNSLRDIFDQCLGDVNWAVEIVLDGMASKQLKTVHEIEISDEEVGQVNSENDQCTCLAAYSIVPDICTEPDQPNTSALNENVLSSQPQKKVKKDNNVSLDSLTAKRLIEQTVGFSDNHYSQHCLKIRKFRRGENEVGEEKVAEESTAVEENLAAVAAVEAAVPNTPEVGFQDIASCLPDNRPSDDEESVHCFDDIEKTVNVNVGKDFIAVLDSLFGRKGMTYPDKVIPRINIPLSILNEINALWMESLMYQLDEHDKQTAIMVREDEDFARQFAKKEAEIALSGKEPEVPDFKEIMDMDFALSLYHKDVAEWRNKEPNDLAAKLTREKLYNLFPDVQKETLSELLMAHDNNFQSTVEVLLMSIGKDDILKEENGINKFIMKKELERQEKILEKEKKALSQAEWPLLPQGETVQMSDVDTYRKSAERYLAIRNLSLQRANEYVRRGMTQAAGYYNEMAMFNKLKYEQANSLAAAALIQVHASNRNDATIDLHYLRVSEAMEALDLFIDTHIQRLREAHGRGPRVSNLFFITGRGLHSNGRPRIKPAVKRRLYERGLTSSERNPGLLAVRVCAEDKMSHQIQ